MQRDTTILIISMQLETNFWKHTWQKKMITKWFAKMIKELGIFVKLTNHDISARVSLAPILCFRLFMLCMELRCAFLDSFYHYSRDSRVLLADCGFAYKMRIASRVTRKNIWNIQIKMFIVIFGRWNEFQCSFRFFSCINKNVKIHCMFIKEFRGKCSKNFTSRCMR